jgi:predicted nuclease of predicted toxin-antitoxin system
VKVKLDENVTVVASSVLTAAGHDADTVSDERLTGVDDETLLQVCQREQRMLITFDVGLGDVRAHPPGSHHGVVLLRLISRCEPSAD